MIVFLKLNLFLCLKSTKTSQHNNFIKCTALQIYPSKCSQMPNGNCDHVINKYAHCTFFKPDHGNESLLLQMSGFKWSVFPPGLKQPQLRGL